MRQRRVAVRKDMFTATCCKNVSMAGVYSRISETPRVAFVDEIEISIIETTSAAGGVEAFLAPTIRTDTWFSS